MVKVKSYDNEAKNSLIKRFKKISFFKKMKFKEGEYFIKPAKLREKKRRDKNKRNSIIKFKR